MDNSLQRHFFEEFTKYPRDGALHELLACEFGRDIADKVFFRNARDFFERVESV